MRRDSNRSHGIVLRSREQQHNPFENAYRTHPRSDGAGEVKKPSLVSHTRGIHEQVLPVLRTLGLKGFVQERFQFFPEFRLDQSKSHSHSNAPVSNQPTQVVHGLMYPLDDMEDDGKPLPSLLHDVQPWRFPYSHIIGTGQTERKSFLPHERNDTFHEERVGFRSERASLLLEYSMFRHRVCILKSAHDQISTNEKPFCESTAMLFIYDGPSGFLPKISAIVLSTVPEQAPQRNLLACALCGAQKCLPGRAIVEQPYPQPHCKKSKLSPCNISGRTKEAECWC